MGKGTYNPRTGVYTSPSGEKKSYAQAPAGSIIIGGGSGRYTGGGSAEGINFPLADATAKAEGERLAKIQAEAEARKQVELQKAQADKLAQEQLQRQVVVRQLQEQARQQALQQQSVILNREDEIQKQYTFNEYGQKIVQAVKTDVSKLASREVRIIPRETINTIFNYGGNLIAEKTGLQKYNPQVNFISPTDIFLTTAYAPFFKSTFDVGTSVGALAPKTKTTFYSEYKPIQSETGDVYKVSTIAKTTSKQGNTFGISQAYTGLGTGNKFAGKGFTISQPAKDYSIITQEAFLGKVDDIGQAVFKKQSVKGGLNFGTGVSVKSNTNIVSVTKENPYVVWRSFKKVDVDTNYLYGGLKELKYQGEGTGYYVFRGGTEATKRITYNAGANQFRNILKINQDTVGFLAPAKVRTATIKFVPEANTGLMGNVPTQSLTLQTLKQVQRAISPIVSSTKTQALNIFKSGVATESAIISTSKAVLPSIFAGQGLYERTEGGSISKIISKELSITKLTDTQIPRVSSTFRTENKTREQEKLKDIQKQPSLLRTEQPTKQKEKLNQGLQFKQLQQQRYKNPAFSFSLPRPKPTERFIGLGYLPYNARYKKAPTTRFTTLVRRRGRFTPVGIFSSYNKAFLQGKNIVSRTLGASFKVTGEGTPTNLSGLYRSKKDYGVFIEKRKYRLSKKQELEEIDLFRRRKKRGLFG